MALMVPPDTAAAKTLRPDVVELDALWWHDTVPSSTNPNYLSLERAQHAILLRASGWVARTGGKGMELRKCTRMSGQSVRCWVRNVQPQWVPGFATDGDLLFDFDEVSYSARLKRDRVTVLPPRWVLGYGVY